MDIEELYTVETHEQGAEIRLKNQYGKDTDLYITIAGIDSNLWRAEKFRMEKSALNRYANSANKDLDTLAKEANELTCESLANITLNWRGFTSNGEELVFSKEKAKELYLCAPYIRDQVDKFFSDRSNFTKS